MSCDSPGYTISWVSRPRLLSAWYICSELLRGTFQSSSPQRKSVGVTIRSACRKGYETRVHASGFFHGFPSSASYSMAYMSVP
jgi:hypothetical protein